MQENTDTVVIGGGQAGLAISYYLTQQGKEHVVLERSRVGESWRHRWDTFTLVTPNWTIRLPGFHYEGSNPDAFLARDQVVEYLETYASLVNAPLRLGVRADSVEQDPSGTGYQVRTNQGTVRAGNVVVATGSYHQPRIPSMSDGLPDRLLQLHTSQYRNAETLPDGAVLVVGSGQSGAQIAEELYQSGRKVYLCVGGSGRLPRRYRGMDATRWMELMGMSTRTVDALPSPKAKFAGSVQASGKDGGHTLNLHQFAKDGVVLLGRLRQVGGEKVSLAPDLTDNLAKADKMAADFKMAVDKFVSTNGMDAPEELAPNGTDQSFGFQVPVLSELDLQSAGVNTVIWGTGYEFDYGLVRLPAFDEDGYPVQRRGVTAYPGLYFLGLVWMHTGSSSLLWGVGEDAAHVAAHIADRT